MSDDYANPQQRKSKKDLRKKRRDRIYKRGGKYRSIKIEAAAVKTEEVKKKQKGKKKK